MCCFLCHKLRIKMFIKLIIKPIQNIVTKFFHTFLHCRYIILVFCSKPKPTLWVNIGIIYKNFPKTIGISLVYCSSKPRQHIYVSTFEEHPKRMFLMPLARILCFSVGQFVQCIADFNTFFIHIGWKLNFGFIKYLHLFSPFMLDV